jgi:hypothetical protein
MMVARTEKITKFAMLATEAVRRVVALDAVALQRLALVAGHLREEPVHLSSGDLK